MKALIVLALAMACANGARLGQPHGPVAGVRVLGSARSVAASSSWESLLEATQQVTTSAARATAAKAAKKAMARHQMSMVRTRSHVVGVRG